MLSPPNVDLALATLPDRHVGSTAYHARLLAIVRSAPEPGTIALTAQTRGLPAARMDVEARVLVVQKEKKGF